MTTYRDRHLAGEYDPKKQTNKQAATSSKTKAKAKASAKK